MARTVTYTNVAGLRKAFRVLPKDLMVELRDASMDIADDVARKAGMRARMVGGVMRYVAPTIRARRDRVPKIVMGGTTRLPARDGGPRRGTNQTVGNVIWGGEWGSDRHRQFSPWSREGYVLWPTIDAESDKTMERYGEALLRAVDKTASKNDR